MRAAQTIPADAEERPSRVSRRPVDLANETLSLRHNRSGAKS